MREMSTLTTHEKKSGHLLPQPTNQQRSKMLASERSDHGPQRFGSPAERDTDIYVDARAFQRTRPRMLERPQFALEANPANRVRQNDPNNARATNLTRRPKANRKLRIPSLTSRKNPRIQEKPRKTRNLRGLETLKMPNAKGS